MEPYVEDLSIYGLADEYETQFDIANWGFYRAFDAEISVGAMTVAGTTAGYPG